MFKDSLRIAALSLAALTVFAVAGCGAPNPRETPPPAMSASEPAQPPPDLMGGPSSQPLPAPASDEPESAAAEAPATMQPIPNPQDVTPEQRRPGAALHARHGRHHRWRHLAAPMSPPEPATHQGRDHDHHAAAAARSDAAANHGSAAIAQTPAAGPPRHVHGQPTAGLSGATSALPPSAPASSARSNRASASPAAASQSGAPSNAKVAHASAATGPQGKVIAAIIVLLIALAGLIAAARNSMMGRPRRRPPDFGARPRANSNPPAPRDPRADRR